MCLFRSCNVWYHGSDKNLKLKFMRPSQQRYHTSLGKCITWATSRQIEGKKSKKTENKLHVRDSINFNILSINKWSKKKMENMHRKGGVGGKGKKNGSKTTTKIYTLHNMIMLLVRIKKRREREREKMTMMNFMLANFLEWSRTESKWDGKRL